MNHYPNKLIMYHEIHKMNREGFSKSKISQYLVVNRRTVNRILSMDEMQFEAFLESQTRLVRICNPRIQVLDLQSILYQANSISINPFSPA